MQLKTKPLRVPQGMLAFKSLLAKLRHHMAPWGLFRSLVGLLHKISAWGRPSGLVETVGRRDRHASSPARPMRQAKKRLSRLARLLFTVIPSRFRQALGYVPAAHMAQGGIPEEIQKSPVKPLGKGSKRKQDDVALEEHQSWVEVLQEELLEEETEDSTYEPTRSETDSEEYRSQNDTETDLEFEERDGVLELKDSPDGQAALTGENVPAPASGGGEAPEQPAPASGGGEAPEQPAPASGGGEAPEQPAPASGGDYQEPWAEVMG
ncbi:uncharacterized protein LOC142819043 isoform X2 [Pelodiscus sinensis]|uniref:uncharacterized protein LOC142819043 isoform X2 n=1 Tax=Pelodiscus sinensis TaxID=13735 RepID=UPI003F6D0912